MKRLLMLAISSLPITAYAENQKPLQITLDNCTRVETKVNKVESANGTLWLQSVTCFGDRVSPEIHKETAHFSGLLFDSNDLIAK